MLQNNALNSYMIDFGYTFEFVYYSWYGSIMKWVKWSLRNAKWVFFLALSWWEQVPLGWNDNNDVVYYVLDQHAF